MRLRTRQADLAVFIDVLLEVVVFGDDGLGDERQVDNADGGQQGGTVGVGQPRDLRGLLVVLVLQVQTSLQGDHLGIGPSEQRERVQFVTVTQRSYNPDACGYDATYLLILVMMRLPQLMKVTISPSEKVSASAPSTRTRGPYQTSFMPTSAFWVDTKN